MTWSFMHDFADFFLSRTHTLVQTRYRKNGAQQIAQQILKDKLMLDFDYLFIYLFIYYYILLETIIELWWYVCVSVESLI